MEPNTQPSARERFEAAQELFGQQKYLEALRELHLGFKADSGIAQMYELAARAYAKVGGHMERDYFTAAYERFEDAQPFLDLGFYFVGDSLYDQARPFLERCLTLDPSNTEAALELSLAHAGRFDIPKALEAIERMEYQHDFWLSLRRFQCRLLNRQTEGITEFIRDVRKQLEEQDANETIDMALNKLRELDAMHRRYALLSEPGLHVRDWHFIQFGAIILDFFEDDQDAATGGRFVASWGSMEWMRSILTKLEGLLRKLERMPQRVLALDDRDSQILGRALASILQLPFDLYEDSDSLEHCLIVAGESNMFNTAIDLAPVLEGQTVFALSVNWFADSMITPDISGFLAQTFFFPWEPGVKVLENGKTEMRKADTRDAEDIAAELAAMPAPPLEGFQETLAFYSRLAPYCKGGSQGGSERLTFTVESPVPSPYFM